MSILTLFTRKTPTLAGFELDAVLEDTLELGIELPQYPIESGASVADHRIILPFRWRLIAAVSNNPLNVSITDFTGLLSNLAGGSGALATIAGLSAGLLAGSDETRASQTLQFLISLMVGGEPFDIDAGDIQLSNMQIENLRRVKNPENENALVFEAQLKEIPTLDTLSSRGQPKQSQLSDNDSSKWSISALVNKGEQSLKEVGTSIRDKVSSVVAAL